VILAHYAGGNAITWLDLRGGVSVSDRERPLVTGVNGPLMARLTQDLDDPSEIYWSRRG